MPTVRLAFSAAPQYVRTARLVAVAVARRAGVPEELLDEVRLAIGEACGRAVARHRRHGTTKLVRVEMSDDGPYTVQVIDAGGAEPAAGNGSGPVVAGNGAGPVATGDGAGPVADDAGPVAGGDDAGPVAGDDEDAERMHDALLAAVARDLVIVRHEQGTEVRMVWPVRRRLSGTAHP